MRRAIRVAGLIALVGIPFFVAGFAIPQFLPQSRPRLFTQVLQRLTTDALDTIPSDTLYEMAARGLVERIGDPYADLYSPEQLAAFARQQIGSQYAGMGMTIQDQDGAIIVTRVFPGTPAEGVGIIAGDRILAVDGASTRGLKVDEVTAKLLGAPGTPVKIAVQRTGVTDPIEFAANRAVITIPAVPFAIMLDGNVGYIPLQRFNSNAAEEVAASIQRLKASGAKSFVLDLRGNPGGELDEAVEVTDLFLNGKQEVVRVVYRNQPTDVYESPGRSMITDAPLVVLTDGYSASASEIVAGALQDHDRALVVGTRSFGKGVVQNVFRLEGGWALKMTTGRWYTPVGRSIQTELQPVTRAEATAAHDSTKPRPEFRTDGGRIVYGGGGITPDLMIRQDSLTPAEDRLSRALGPASQQVYNSVYDFSRTLRTSVKPDFTTRPEWRREVYDRLAKAGVKVDSATYAAGGTLIDRLVEQRVANIAFGDSTAFRRSSRFDPPLLRATALLKQTPSQKELFALADKQRKTEN